MKLLTLLIIFSSMDEYQTKPVEPNSGRDVSKETMRLVRLDGEVGSVTSNGGQNKGNELWTPPPDSGMTREEFLETHGMGREKHLRVRGLARRLKDVIAKKYGHENTLSGEADEIFDDIVFSESQLEYLLATYDPTHPRKIMSSPESRWDVSPIPFAFDGSHTRAQKKIIRSAIAHWEENTCLRFREYSNTNKIKGHYILFTAEIDRCSSELGKSTTEGTPQLINLASKCLNEKLLGTPIHEIGHAIGFFHEHVRYDRDNYVTILTENVIPEKLFNFEIVSTDRMTTHGVEYDLSSVMHYPGKAFAIDKATQHTVQTVDPLYSLTTRNYDGLTFFDTKLADLVYCSETCSETLPCQRGGYQDQTDCSRCRCLEGFGGPLCETVQESTGEKCSEADAGVVLVDSTNDTCIDFVGYNNNNAELSCNWHLQAPCGRRIRFWFDPSTPFGMLCLATGDACIHYVEVNFKAGLASRGPRFCCSDVPDFAGAGAIVSEDNEMMITFRSGYRWESDLKGFRMCFKLEDEFSEDKDACPEP